MKRTIISILVLCLLLLSATALASPKSDFKDIWDKQTIQDGRYQIYIDTRFALFGPVQSHSIIDITCEPLFVRSEDTMTMFGKSKTATTYAVQNGDKIDIYTEEEQKDTAAPAKWVRTAVSLPNGGQDAVTLDEMKALMPDYDDIIRSVKLVDNDEQKGQLYAVTLDGRTFYKNLKQYYDSRLETAEEAQSTDSEYRFEMPETLSDTVPGGAAEASDKKDELDPKLIRALQKELLATWKDTESIIILARVKDGEIKAVQSELAPQFNAVMHVVTTAVDLGQGGDGYQIGGLMEAFLQTDKMRVTVIRDGKAQYTAVPQDIILAAEDKPLDERMPAESRQDPAADKTEAK